MVYPKYIKGTNIPPLHGIQEYQRALDTIPMMMFEDNEKETKELLLRIRHFEKDNQLAHKHIDEFIRRREHQA